MNNISNWKWLLDGNKKDILDRLKAYKPQDDKEYEWYQNPKMWKKYLNTIYDQVMKISG